MCREISGKIITNNNTISINSITISSSSSSSSG
jgi:hypothetical protein